MLQTAKTVKERQEVDLSGVCEWFINSEEYNYCFWLLNKELSGSPMSDREICQLLCITQAELEATYDNAISKLQENKDSPEVADLIELILEQAQSSAEDNTTFLPDTYRDKIEQIEAEAAGEEKPQGKRGRPKKGFGMPMHRDGRKVDLWGLSSNKKKNEKKKP